MGDHIVETDDVKTLLGNPKKALIAMAIPMMIATVVQSANNMIDAIWLAGLGTGALAATGVVFPLFFVVMGFGNGIGVGASQALSRRIGAGDYDGTSKVAAQAVMIGLAGGLVMTVAFLLLAEPLLSICGAGEYLDECMEYAIPILLFIPVFLIGSILSGLLRSEGASKRAMNIQVVGAAINIVLDPIFIYIFGWGIAGAAWATSISMTVSMVIGLYWYFIKKDTFVRIPLRGFRLDKGLDWDIMKVGIPASMEFIIMSLVAVIMNRIILGLDPVNGIAIYSSGWRALEIVMIPAMSFGFSIVPICAAAYGAGRIDKFRQTYRLSVLYGTCTMIVLAVILLVFAPQISVLFSYSEGMEDLGEQLTVFLRVGALFIPFVTVSYASSSMFQSLGMGTRSLVATVMMHMLGVPICAALSTFGDLSMIWYGLTVSEIAGAAILGTWAVRTVRRLGDPMEKEADTDRIGSSRREQYYPASDTSAHGTDRHPRTR